MEVDVDNVSPLDSAQIDPHKQNPLVLGMALGGFAVLSKVEIPAENAATYGNQRGKK